MGKKQFSFIRFLILLILSLGGIFLFISVTGIKDAYQALSFSQSYGEWYRNRQPCYLIGKLEEASRKGDHRTEKKFFKIIKKLRAEDVTHWPGGFSGMLPCAIRGRHLDLVREILKKGADPNQRDLEGYSPLWWTAQTANVEIAKVLVEAGAKPEREENFRKDPLYMAVEKNLNELLEIFLQNNPPCEIFNYNGQSLLHMAVLKGRKDMVSTLLNHGFDINARNKDGKTPLMLAVDNILEKRYKYFSGRTSPEMLGGIESFAEVASLLRLKGSEPDAREKLSLFFGSAVPFAVSLEGGFYLVKVDAGEFDKTKVGDLLLIKRDGTFDANPIGYSIPDTPTLTVMENGRGTEVRLPDGSFLKTEFNRAPDYNYYGKQTTKIARFTTEGRKDPSFHDIVLDYNCSSFPQGDGSILVACVWEHDGASISTIIKKYQTDGIPDPQFHPLEMENEIIPLISHDEVYYLLANRGLEKVDRKGKKIGTILRNIYLSQSDPFWNNWIIIQTQKSGDVLIKGARAVSYAIPPLLFLSSDGKIDFDQGEKLIKNLFETEKWKFFSFRTIFSKPLPNGQHQIWGQVNLNVENDEELNKKCWDMECLWRFDFQFVVDGKGNIVPGSKVLQAV